MALRLLTFIILGLSIHSMSAQSYSFVWKNEKAVAVQFEKVAYEGIKIKGSSKYLLGHLRKSESEITFTPLIPFRSNYVYEVWSEDEKIFEFSPQAELTQPKLVSFFPMADTVPSNFLKFSFSFNIPMGEVNPYEKISLYKGDEKIENAVLLLNPPLWNGDYTLLTVWLEPGRIKTGLGPNQQRGVILNTKDNITISVEPFRAQNGELVPAKITKKMIVSARDQEKPSMAEWEISDPNAGSLEKLMIYAHEAMDYTSTLKAIHIVSDDEVFPGTFQFENDSIICFKPKGEWKIGNYRVRVDSKAEDLAGNNFIRLFEVDLSQENSKNNVTTDFQYTDFKVQSPPARD